MTDSARFRIPEPHFETILRVNAAHELTHVDRLVVTLAIIQTAQLIDQSTEKLTFVGTAIPQDQHAAIMRSLNELDPMLHFTNVGPGSYDPAEPDPGWEPTSRVGAHRETAVERAELVAVLTRHFERYPAAQEARDVEAAQIADVVLAAGWGPGCEPSDPPSFSPSDAALETLAHQLFEWGRVGPQVWSDLSARAKETYRYRAATVARTLLRESAPAHPAAAAPAPRDWRQDNPAHGKFCDGTCSDPDATSLVCPSTAPPPAEPAQIEDGGPRRVGS